MIISTIIFSDNSCAFYPRLSSLPIIYDLYDHVSNNNPFYPNSSRYTILMILTIPLRRALVMEQMSHEKEQRYLQEHPDPTTRTTVCIRWRGGRGGCIDAL